MAEDTLPVQARAERLLVNRQHSSNRRMAEDLEVTSSLSTVEDTQAVLVRAERLMGFRHRTLIMTKEDPSGQSRFNPLILRLQLLKRILKGGLGRFR
jgi:hypothetical protein